MNMYNNIFKHNVSKTMLYGTITAAILIAIMYMINPVMGYTLDATLKPRGDTPILSLANFDMNNIKITDLPEELHATNATLTSMLSTDKPMLQVFNDHVGYIGQVQYTTPDGSTNLGSTLFSPSIKKMSPDGTGLIIKVKDVLFGGKGIVTLNGPIKTATSGTVHIEGIDDPKADKDNVD